jgi:hypothetical protein
VRCKSSPWPIIGGGLATGVVVNPSPNKSLNRTPEPSAFFFSVSGGAG